MLMARFGSGLLGYRYEPTEKSHYREIVGN
jgi:hypothetical protein